MLNMSGNALNVSSAGVAASSSTRCKVCRPKGIRNKCTREEVEHCISGRPLDRLWWRAAALTVHLQGNPLCDELNHPLEIQPSGELYRGGVECEILQGEGDCFQHKHRKVFLAEACYIVYNSTNEIMTIIEGGTIKSYWILIATGVLGITIGILITTLLPILRRYLEPNRSHVGEQQELLARLNNPSDSTRPNNSPLHALALEGNLKKLMELQNKGEGLTQKNSRGESPLWCAAFAGHHKVVQYLLDNIPPEEVQSADQNGDTSLHVAVNIGNTKCTKFLINAGANINAKNKEGLTPLHVAVSTEFTNIIRLLLDNGTNINETNVKGETPLLVAVRSGQLEAVKLLLEKRADVNQANRVQQLPLHIAAWNENYEMVDLLLSHNAQKNRSDGFGNSILHIVCSKGKASEVLWLLDHGADKNARNKKNKTPLHKAVEGDHCETVQLLLQYGADVNAKNCDGLTPLEFARKTRSRKCEDINKLLKHFS